MCLALAAAALALAAAQAAATHAAAAHAAAAHAAAAHAAATLAAAAAAAALAAVPTASAIPSAFPTTPSFDPSSPFALHRHHERCRHLHWPRGPSPIRHHLLRFRG